MKTQKVASLAAVLFVTLSAPPLTRAQPVSAAAATRHSLWKVEGKRNKVYLLGSVHALKPENYPLAAPIESAFTNAQVVVLETEQEALEKPAVQQKIFSQGRLPEGETLSKQLSEPVYKRFAEQMKQSGFPAEMFDQLKPPLAMMTLVVLEMQKLGLDPEYGLDKHFANRARKDGKEIVPLETADFQVGLLTGFTKEEGEALVKTTLADLGKMKTELPELVKAWETGDTAKLEKLLNQAMEEEPVIFKRLVTDRNRSWLPKLQELAGGEKNVIVIVGAGHLVGKEGVVEMLRKTGLRIAQQ
jgi:uncharacterized protein YbaP (TraB family)